MSGMSYRAIADIPDIPDIPADLQRTRGFRKLAA
jgi:hypothetical protein